LRGFVKRFQILAPGRLLGVIDFAQVEDDALQGVTGAQPAVFDDALVAMHLAVFLASVVAQKHAVGRQCITVAERCGRGQVSTCGLWKRRSLLFSDLHHAKGEKTLKALHIHEISVKKISSEATK
jgi:hypothetical protein